MMAAAKHSADALSTAVGIIIGLSVLFFVYRGSELLPQLDAYVLPVIQFERTTDIERVAHDERYPSGRVCFTMHIHKIRNGFPLPYKFYAALTSGLSPEVALAVHIADKDDKRVADQTYGQGHAAGSTWARRYCGELPGTFSDADELSVRGEAFHVRHPFWHTETPIPPFIVPAVKG